MAAWAPVAVRDLGAGGGPAGVLLSSSDSDPDLESVDCLRCRGCRRRLASVASLRLHINHIKLRNTKCASQARKNPRILVITWRRGRDGQATGVVDGLEADQDSMAAAGNNMDLPVDADLDLHQVKGLRVCPVCNKCALSVKSASWVWPVCVGQKVLLTQTLHVIWPKYGWCGPKVSQVLQKCVQCGPSVDMI